MNFGFGGAFHAHILPPPFHDTGVGTIFPMDVAGVDDGTVPLTELMDQLFDIGQTALVDVFFDTSAAELPKARRSRCDRAGDNTPDPTRYLF